MQVMAGAAHGGAEAFFERHVVAMHEAGIEQLAVIRRDAGRAARLRAGGVTVHEARFGGFFDIFTKPEIAGLGQRYKPDVVLTWMNRATAKTPRGDYVLCARLGGYYDLKYYRHCDHLIGNTPGIHRYLLEQGWAPERAHYLPNFADEASVAPAPREALDTPDGAPLIFALGRLHTVKGFDILLTALADVPDAILWLAGEGPEDAALKAHAKSAGVADRVRFLGWRDDGASLMAAADIMVCPSRHEPLGNVVLEAWARNVPVISTRSAGPGEMIEDGENGVLVDIDDADTMAREINRLIADAAVRRDIGEAGGRALQQRFSKDAVVARYLEFFETVVGQA
ncbi:MAG: glycosyltransferase [Rhodospirillales bacterium]